LPNYKVEVKNINSFRFVEKAIQYEIKRQSEILDKGEIPAQETRGYNETKNATISQRSKEEAHDYRYFPEPDIPPFRWTHEFIDKLKKETPELPDRKFERFQKDYGLSFYDCEILTRERQTADVFEEAVKEGKGQGVTPKQVANHIINKKTNIQDMLPAELVKKIYQASQTSVIDLNIVNEAVKNAISENIQAVEDYKSGKTQVMGVLIGKTKQILGPQSDAEIIKKAIEALLKRM
jgi:aspartyl-tRNA(Asn)/glutamyl-tRNA(Gln) amidotransferase subunit B